MEDKIEFLRKKVKELNSPVPTSPLNIKQATELIIENSLDFFSHAIEQFDDYPKYALINFSSGIELILKAKIVSEHWALLVDGKPNYKNFLDGKFKSLGFAKIIERINEIVKEKISAEARKSFERISNHRNKIVHFYHPANNLVGMKELKEELSREMISAWWHVRKIILEEWRDTFRGHEREVVSLNEGMLKYELYLRDIYNRIRPQIDQKKEDGVLFVKCLNCQLDAAEIAIISELLFKSTCLICSISQIYLKFKCNNVDCNGEKNIPEGDDNIICCEKCKKEINKEDFLGPLLKNNDSEFSAINCFFCGSPSSVLEQNDYYVCSSCSAVSEEVFECGWCGERIMGISGEDESFFKGCGFCNGRMGWKED